MNERYVFILYCGKYSKISVSMMPFDSGTRSSCVGRIERHLYASNQNQSRDKLRKEGGFILVFSFAFEHEYVAIR